METKPWLRSYDAGVPPTLAPYPAATLLDVIAATARQRPNHTALIFKGTRITYLELEQQSDALAAALAGLGVRKGDRVALLLPNSPQAVIAQVGAWKAGAIVAPLNPLYTEAELEYALNNAGAIAVIALTPYYGKVKAVQPRTQVRSVIAAHIGEYLPLGLRLAFRLLKDRQEGHRIQLRAGDHWFLQMVAGSAGAPRPAVAVTASDPALLISTGGTTGSPKAAVGTHGSLYMAGRQLHTWAQGVLVDWDDSIVLALPLFHAAGNVGVFTTAVVGRNPLVLVPDPRNLDDLVQTVQKLRPSFLPGVPTLFIALLNHPAVRSGRADFSSLKLSFAGAAPLMAETRQRWETLTGGRIIEAYALTESMMAAILGPVRGEDRPGAVGLPLPDVEVRITPLAEDIPGGAEPASLPAGEVGEIILRAPQLMQGYWNRPDETGAMLRDGWLYTGDLGHLDEAGYVYIVDRKKDLIKPSGFQVWPREVEEVIAAHPAVSEVSVAGVPDPYQGEAVKAWVVLRADADIAAEALQAHCRERLAAYKVPRQIEFRAALPKSAVGKVLRRALVAEGRRS
jgi:long-chain acyl-CoA synthetase